MMADLTNGGASDRVGKYCENEFHYTFALIRSNGGSGCIGIPAGKYDIDVGCH